MRECRHSVKFVKKDKILTIISLFVAREWYCSQSWSVCLRPSSNSRLQHKIYFITKSKLVKKSHFSQTYTTVQTMTNRRRPRNPFVMRRYFHVHYRNLEHETWFAMKRFRYVVVRHVGWTKGHAFLWCFLMEAWYRKYHWNEQWFAKLTEQFLLKIFSQSFIKIVVTLFGPAALSWFPTRPAWPAIPAANLPVDRVPPLSQTPDGCFWN